MKKKLVVVLILSAVIITFWGFDLHHVLSLENLKSSHEYLISVYTNYPIRTVAIFFAVYVVAVSLNLPGATILGLAGGGIFGFLYGTIIISFASTIGATIGCFISRYLLRDFVEEKFGKTYEKVNNGIRREGTFYLFSLRLIPIIPFFVINMVMGLTRIPLKTFYLVSQLGMLPGTMVYVNAGKELGQIDSISDILSPQLMLAFTLLGVFPFVVKKIVSAIRPIREQD